MFFFGNKEKKDRETDKICLNLIKKLSICKEYFLKSNDLSWKIY
jgi:hypothetical protein